MLHSIYRCKTYAIRFEFRNVQMERRTNEQTNDQVSKQANGNDEMLRLSHLQK